LLQSFAAGGDFLLPEMFFLLHANLTVKMVDPTAGDPGAGESDPPGDAQQFPSFFESTQLRTIFLYKAETDFTRMTYRCEQQLSHTAHTHTKP
jgi:hypothetical protein